MNDKTQVATRQAGALAKPIEEQELLDVLRSSLYPGAKEGSIKLVLSYCKAAGLDPLLKPVHIVPMWDSKAQELRDTVMPGIGLYRTQASRTNQHAGTSEPEFGQDVTEEIGGLKVTYPSSCKVVVRRILPNGHVAEHVAVERWKENYAIKGGKEKSVAPNAMWARRPYAQLAKCAEAQALRKAFPELGAAPTADEMEGRALDDDVIDVQPIRTPQPKVQADPATTAGETATTDTGKAETATGDFVLNDKHVEEFRARCKNFKVSEAEVCKQFGLATGDAEEATALAAGLKGKTPPAEIAKWIKKEGASRG